MTQSAGQGPDDEALARQGEHALASRSPEQWALLTADAALAEHEVVGGRVGLHYPSLAEVRDRLCGIAAAAATQYPGARLLRVTPTPPVTTRFSMYDADGMPLMPLTSVSLLIQARPQEAGSGALSELPGTLDLEVYDSLEPDARSLVGTRLDGALGSRVQEYGRYLNGPGNDGDLFTTAHWPWWQPTGQDAAFLDVRQAVADAYQRLRAALVVRPPTVGQQ